MTKSDFTIRQGDVLLVKVDSLGEGHEKTKTEKGKYMLAYGEATGHSHHVYDTHGELYNCNDNICKIAKRYGVTDDRAVKHGLRIVVDNTKLLHGTAKKGFVEPTDPDHDAIELPVGDYLVIMPREYSDDDEFRQIAD